MSDKTKTFSTRIKSKRDTSANWESANPVLLNGEKIIVDTSAGEVREKIGDGVKTYSQLPFTDEKIRGLITEKADEVELERLKYYGDKDIIPSPENYFTVNSTGETITGLTDTGKTQTELVIPYEINGKKITSLLGSVIDGEPQSILSGNNVITKVIIPNSITSIGDIAFYDCSSLTSINIPNSVTSIGDSAFGDCSSLTSINIPNSVTSIEDYAFIACSSLTKVEIPSSVTSIGYDAFYGCTNLKIYCEQGSYAETFAKGKHIPIVYTDIDPSKYLTKDNTTEFTPTADYHPATKKYVDDSAATKVNKVEGKSLIDENVANNLSSDTTTVRIKKGTELKTNGSEINGVRIDDNSVTVEDVKNDMSDPYIGYKNVMDKDGLHIYGVDPGGNQDTNERVDITSSGVKYSGAQGNGRTLKLGFEGAGFPQLTMDGNPGESKSVKIDFDDVIVQNESTTHKLSEKVDKVEGKSLIDESVAKYITYNAEDDSLHIDTLRHVNLDDHSFVTDFSGKLEFRTFLNLPNNNTDYDGGRLTLDPSGLKLRSNFDQNTDVIDISQDGIKVSSCSGQSNQSIVVNAPLGEIKLITDGKTHKLSEKANTSDVLVKDSSGRFVYGGTKISQTQVATIGHALTEKAEAKTYTVSVPTTSWTEKTDTGNQKYYYKKITVSGMESSGQAMTDVVMSDSVATARQEMEAYQCVNRVVTGNGYVELYCFEEVPTTAFTLRILVISNILS